MELTSCNRQLVFMKTTSINFDLKSTAKVNYKTGDEFVIQ